ncbi:sigma-54-dependent Fis family transcriptional regulator [Cryomorphaceae bacterium]|nr:sigma-54-dependent Fis family transcriptional regulator [Cryomorphaceae bacterium]
MKALKIFVVEDDLMYGKVLEHFLSLNPDNDVHLFPPGKLGIDKLHERPDVVSLDYSLPDLSGADVLKKIKAYNKDIPVIIVSGQEDVSTAVELLKNGAYDYVVKDEDTKDRLWNLIKNLRETIDLQSQLDELKKEVTTKYEYSNIIKGNSAAIKRVFNLIEKAIKTNITVSITGETGTGKELVAKAIHYNSPRKKKPFVTVNIAAIPSNLIESELFGHEKGAFTDAISRRIGKFEEAHTGTIFLDEIGEMDLHLQAKLLRVLQEKEITRIGGSGSKKIDSRVVVATHRDLAEEVRKGNFREDLYYRLLGLPIEIAPLRERSNDILLLAKFFLDEFTRDNGMDSVVISNEAQTKLMNYLYPGNVRELKATIELSAVMASEGVIQPEDISFNSTNKMSDLFTEEKTLRDYQLSIIRHFMEKYDNNIDTVANKLKIGKSTIYRMIQTKELEIN